MQSFDSLILKYNQSVPRYTSYPTVPFWKDVASDADWKQLVREQLNNVTINQQGISLYIHLPFCESLCTYCACNKKITTNHSVEEKYITALLKEWQLYTALMPSKPMVKAIHLGGGTPTFFSPENLNKLLKSILSDVILSEDADCSFEGHPNNTTAAHLQTLFDLGFNRVSYGVQDSNPVVQKAINRIQPHENVERATNIAREIGYTSVNFDLIYGLPFQTLEGMEQTIRTTIQSKPDRIAFYSYAHVPWKLKVQRLFDENDLPDPAMKNKLYQKGKELLVNAGYRDIGMDHFALPTDPLFEARETGSLHRNFMGYTEVNSSVLIGLGVSSISDIGTAYSQNHKEIESYYRAIEKGDFPVAKGYTMQLIDQVFKKYILEIICKGKTHFQESHSVWLSHYTMPLLEDLEEDGLIILKENSLEVTKLGFNFLRNICKAFDIKWLSSEESNVKFSKAI